MKRGEEIERCLLDAAKLLIRASTLLSEGPWVVEAMAWRNTINGFLLALGSMSARVRAVIPEETTRPPP